ncbi:MAG TPA: cysteine hydrolase [Alcanivorax sp.]|nr:cysteine hydrolase [Alcanivorax sp.]|tara:strand:- start:3742 stop:4440 length:699 start_codon:yes stop_codon:yes gene_type:complete
MSGFSPLSASRPYAWPLAGGWDNTDTALLMIDLQRDFLDPEGYFARLGEDTGHGRRVLEPARRLLAAARRAGLRVIHTREGHRPDLSDLNDTKRLRAESAGAAIGSHGPLGRLLVRGEPGWEIIDSVAPEPGEPVVDKCGNGAFYATDLEQLLRRAGIRNLILCGVTTDVCVSSTLREANDRGFDCLVLEDVCGAARPELHDAVFEGLEREGGIFGAFANSGALLATLGAAG